MKRTEQNKNIVIDLLSRPFSLLDDHKSKLFLVVFCGLFATLFILYFNPFSLQQIQYEASIGKFLSIWSAGIIGAVILSITQFVLRPLFNLSEWTLGQFLGWLCFEFLCLTAVMFIIFAEYNESLLDELMPILKYTVSLALLPYMIACLIIAVFQLSTRLNETDHSSAEQPYQHIFRDEQGKALLVVLPENILCLKSENNYTSVFYLQDGKLQRKLIRTTLKKLEGELRTSYLTRIHRSYMINMKRVATISREKGVYHVHLDYLSEPSLKVSDSYKASFESKMNVIGSMSA